MIKLFESFDSSKILFLHGLDSKPYEDRIEMLQSTGAEVFAPHINYREEDGLDRALKIIEREGITHLVGHSIGGLLAFYLSNTFHLPALMFNPAFGSKNDKLIIRPGRLSEEPYDQQYAVVGLKDDVVSPDKQLANLKYAKVVWTVEDMGHGVPPRIFKKYLDSFANETDI